MYIFRSMLELIYKIRSATNYGQFCYYFYELTVIVNRPDFIASYKKFSHFYYSSSLPGEIDYLDPNRPNEETLNELARQFTLTYPNTINRKPKDQSHVRERVDRLLVTLESHITYMSDVFADPERIRIYYRYYDGQYIVIDDVCYLYRKYKDHYYCTSVALRGVEDVYSSALGPKERYPGNLRPLFNYLYPELSI